MKRFPGEPRAAVQWRLVSKLRRRLLGISPLETSFARRGFRCDSAVLRRHLETVGGCFVQGYLLALEVDEAEPLAARIGAEVPRDFQGFAYEGAAMALTILDVLTPWRRNRLRRFLEGPGINQFYIIYVGSGWALARLPIGVERLLGKLHSIYGWLALDGYGFHQGFFHGQQAIVRQQVPDRVKGYARRVFDQGVGRSLWFVEGADPGRIAADITAFPEARRADLWSGVGLACGYAGGVDRAAIETLKRAAGPATPALAQGVAFAAKARLLGGIPTPAASLACEVVCGMTLEQVAEVTEEALPDGLEADAHPLARRPTQRPVAAELSGTPLFETWRLRIQQRFLPSPA
jgi:enediyne biosynthesis protein E3